MSAGTPIPPGPAQPPAPGQGEGGKASRRPPDIAALAVKLARLEAEIAARQRAAADPYAERSDPMAGAIIADIRSQVAGLQRRLGEAERSRKADLARLHIARRDLGLDADTWGVLIGGLTQERTTSSGELTAAERAALRAALRARGWKPTRAPGRARLRRTAVTETKEALASRVRALLLDAGRPDAYADAIARKRFAVERWEWLDWEGLKKLAQMLAIDQRRRARRAGPQGAA